MSKKPLFLISLLSIVFVLFCSTNAFPIQANGKDKNKDYDYSTVVAEGVSLKAHFFELGGKSTTTPNTFGGGDCTLISFGDGDENDIQILIDCGGTDQDTQSILTQFKKFMNNDKTLEYLIFSHGDDDHIHNFISNNGLGDFLINKEENGYTVQNIVDFDFLNEDDSYVCEEFNSESWKPILDKFSKSENYSKYRNKRNKLIETSSSNYKKITDIINFSNYANSSDSCIALETENQKGDKAVAKLKFLYNYFTDHLSSNELSLTPSDSYDSLIKNNLSVCSALIYGENKFLFTGDLEEYCSGSSYQRVYGESYLCYYNPILQRRDSSGLYQKGFDLFKAGHHGSPTSNSEYLIDEIRPHYVYVTCAYGTKKYTSYSSNMFLCQEVFNNLFKYTDAIYPSSYCKYEIIDDKLQENGQGLYYGSLTFSCNGKDTLCNSESFSSIANPTSHPSITLTDFFRKDTEYVEGSEEYFSRECCSYFYTFASRYKNGNITDYDARCALFKFGNVEILLNCGINATSSNKTLQNNIRDFCVDGCLDYVVVSNFYSKNYNELISEKNSKGKNVNDKVGLIDNIDIGTFIYNGKNSTFSLSTSDPVVKNFDNNINFLKNQNTSIKDISSLERKEFIVLGSPNNSIDFSLSVYSSDMNSDDEDCCSCISVITINKHKYINVGSFQSNTDGSTYDKLFKNLQRYHNLSFGSFDLADLPDGGNDISLTPNFCKQLNSKSSINLFGSCIKGSYKNNGNHPSPTLFSNLNTAIASKKLIKPNIFLMGECGNNGSFNNKNTSEKTNCNGTSDQSSFMVRFLNEITQEMGDRMIVAYLYPKNDTTSRSASNVSRRLKSGVAY